MWNRALQQSAKTDHQTRSKSLTRHSIVRLKDFEIDTYIKNFRLTDNQKFMSAIIWFETYHKNYDHTLISTNDMAMDFPNLLHCY